LEDERRKLGDEHTSDRFSLELEIERVKRDLINAEDQLEGARRDLTKRDLEVAQMVSLLYLLVSPMSTLLRPVINAAGTEYADALDG
jgi:hypothetical protein